ncbi:glycoside hydrolase family 43 protein [Nonomuraea turcica]|uniref:glycoside hydrolase family 43 protein n=1 Tax=Nonomuraea sp. G32 TaxID=3067274 RepID=UPI00273C6874|nr:glycoside hydrolase family 43 protein [Nonomuraea sp. G32]MDP4507157.1 glycoside hydrolase family 43 protein [Nonomuraea sp. G32]
MTRTAIRNPVLPGFHPDPSILRVGADYYLATSTFEWYPGVRVHHSRDLVNWRPLGGILTDHRLLDLAGVPDSGGIWAPDLTYANGLFHLVYGVMDNYAHGYKDIANYLITAPSIEGPWSDPVRLPGRGFDSALFHDDDGTTYLLNMVFDSRPGHGFAGIELQELNGGAGAGKPRIILENRNVTEGPHIYKIDGWYYLMVAEGGTGYEHGASVLRSRTLDGPYEPDPAGPMFTSRHDPTLELQKAGHGCLVRTQDGEWYVAHLAARPHTQRGRCVLGRESAIQRVEWVDGWPRVAGAVPAVEVPAPALPPHPWQAVDLEPAEHHWSTLRRPASPDWVSFDGDRVTITGGQSPYGLRAPSLLARRVTSTTCTFQASLTFEPDSVHQSAGITAYYNSRNWYHLALTTDGLILTGSDRGTRTVHFTGEPATRLGVEFDGPVLRFSADGRPIPVELDATTLSDENADEIIDGQIRSFGFTGAFVGLWVQDLAGEACRATFSDVTYQA